jgi:hypothetical protein
MIPLLGHRKFLIRSILKSATGLSRRTWRVGTAPLAAVRFFETCLPRDLLDGNILQTGY